jgi:ubiquinone/menaquinone biosynthesis C-methylase UbiE
LAVIPNPNKCILEAERVLKHGGQIAVFDKFLPKNRELSSIRKITNIFSNLFFSDITRSFESIVGITKLTLLSDKNAGFKGNFRIIKLTK